MQIYDCRTGSFGIYFIRYIGRTNFEFVEVDRIEVLKTLNKKSQRFTIKYGRWGDYFYDAEEKKPLELKEVLAILNGEKEITSLDKINKCSVCCWNQEGVCLIWQMPMDTEDPCNFALTMPPEYVRKTYAMSWEKRGIIAEKIFKHWCDSDDGGDSN